MSTRAAPIGLDYTPAREQGAGIGRYVRELVAALAREDSDAEWRLFVAGAVRGQLPAPPGPGFEWRPAPLGSRWLTRLWHRARVPLPVEVFTGPICLFHATDFVLPPVRRGTKTVVQIHDLSFLRVPQAAPPGLGDWLKRAVPASVGRADHVLADSRATRDDLLELCDLPSRSAISVLYGGVDARFRPASGAAQEAVLRKYGLPQRSFILSVGTLQPRKNHGRLVEALGLLRRAGLDVQLVIAGGAGWLSGPFHRQLQESGLRQYVWLPGYVDDDDLPALYSAATVFAFPSLYEGFGLPVLEAMACATPVVTSNLSSLPEVAGDAALLVDPLDLEALADAIRRAIEDGELRRRLICAGLERARQFTWSRAARQLLQVYRDLGAQP